MHVSPFALAAIKLLIFTGRPEVGDPGGAVGHGSTASGPSCTCPTRRPAQGHHAPRPCPGRARRRSPRIEGNPHILPGARDGHPLVNISKPLAAILSVAKLEGVSLHVLRHSFASIGVDEGLSLPIVGKLLGHAQPSTTTAVRARRRPGARRGRARGGAHRVGARRREVKRPARPPDATTKTRAAPWQRREAPLASVRQELLRRQLIRQGSVTAHRSVSHPRHDRFAPRALAMTRHSWHTCRRQ